MIEREAWRELHDSDSRISQLEAEVAELRRRVDRDDQARRELLEASNRIIETLDGRTRSWERSIAMIIAGLSKSPELNEAKALLPELNKLFVRLQGFEVQFDELRRLVVALYDMQIRGGPDAA